VSVPSQDSVLIINTWQYIAVQSLHSSACGNSSAQQSCCSSVADTVAHDVVYILVVVAEQPFVS
jgi:positive regulator of sigma E activity